MNKKLTTGEEQKKSTKLGRRGSAKFYIRNCHFFTVSTMLCGQKSSRGDLEIHNHIYQINFHFCQQHAIFFCIYTTSIKTFTCI